MISATNAEEFLFSQKYRPKKLDDCILPAAIKETISDYVAKGEIPHFIFAGSSGSGKTTAALAIASALDSDVLFINASLENGIDLLRTKIQQFASTVSFSGGIKLVILDEADYLNSSSTQPALRAMLEEFSKNCRFIFTCNYKNRLIPQLHSRCTLIDFVYPADETPVLANQMYKRVCGILKNENIEFDKKVVAQLVAKNFPDFRKTLNSIQDYSANGKIDAGILVNLSDDSYKTLFELIKDKNFTETRKWVGENSDVDTTALFRKFYDSASLVMQPQSIPQMVLILAEYQHRAAFVADQEINIMAALTEIMGNCQFK